MIANRGYRSALIGLGGVAVLLAVACGDDDSTSTTTGSGTTGAGAGGGDSGTGAGGTDSTGTGGNGGNGGGTGGNGGGSSAETPVIVPLSAAGSDAFYGVAFADDGSFYATGFVADGTDNAADRSMVVVKFRPTGEKDPTFGTDGVATKNVAVGGRNGETARGIVVQSTGKIVIAGAIEHDVAATGTAAGDRDIALVRFNPDGTPDTTFGTEGVVIFDLNAGVEIMGQNGPTWSGADSSWSLSVRPDDTLVLHGSQRAEGFQPDGVTPRSDGDWVVLSLTADGEPDTAFATNGKFMLDIEEAPGQARSAVLLDDGSVVGAGYSNTPGLGSQQPVLYKLTPAGDLDTSFGVGGVFHQIVLPALAEAYGAAAQGDKLVTVGYGRSTTSESIDWLSIRLTATGELDPSYGDNGVARFDVAGQNDNGRGLVVLPDTRPLLVGGGSPAMGSVDAMIGVLTADGQPDASFAPLGYKLYDLGGAADFFWAAALSPDKKQVVVAGLKGVPADAAGPDANDDAAILILPVGE